MLTDGNALRLHRLLPEPGGQSNRDHLLRDAISTGFGPAAVHNNLGYSYLLIHDLDGAWRSLDEAIRLDSTLQAPFYNRALLCFQKALQVRRNPVRAAGKSASTAKAEPDRAVQEATGHSSKPWRTSARPLPGTGHGRSVLPGLPVCAQPRRGTTGAGMARP